MKREETVWHEARRNGQHPACTVCLHVPSGTGRRIYGALCGFPELITNGRTLKEARHNALEAFELCLEVYQDEGRPFPPSDADPDKTISEIIPVRVARV